MLFKLGGFFYVVFLTERKADANVKEKVSASKACSHVREEITRIEKK